MACSHGCCATNREHWLSIAVAPSATPSRHPQAADVRDRDRRWAEDMPAYRRLRDEGHQPRCVDGSARLEQLADTPAQIQTGLVHVPRTHRSQVDEMVTIQNETP